MEKEKGYVYILTNPSFREDWVKIGKSSRPVDIRSKELDNTAVPLSFDIYATMKTVKYNEVERQIHKQIDRLTDLRIRQNREFFNVAPSVALEIFMDIAEMLDDAEIKIYKDNVDTETLKPKDIPESKKKRDDARRVFWNEFIEYNKQNNGDYAHSSGTPDAWLGKSVKGIKGTSVNVVITSESSRTEIYINTGKKDLNKHIFDKLSEHKTEIESELGELDWQRLDDKITSKICNERPYSYQKASDKKAIFEYFTETTKKMLEVFGKFAEYTE